MALFRSSRKNSDGVDELNIERMIEASAEAMLLPLAHNLECPADDRIDAARDTLQLEADRAVKEHISACDVALQELAANQDSAAMSGRALRWLDQHLGAPGELHGSIGAAVQEQNVARQARLFVNNVSLLMLRVGFVLLLAALALACTVDFLLVQSVTFEANGNSVDGTIPDEMYWPLTARAALTIGLYTLSSIMLHWRKGRVLAVVPYGVVFAALCYYLWPTIDPDLWVVWRVLVMLLLATLYTLPGLLLMLSEQKLVWVIGMMGDYRHCQKITGWHNAAMRLTARRDMAREQLAQVAGLVTTALRHTADKMRCVYLELQAKAGKVINGAGQPEHKARAREQFDKATRCLDALKGLALAMLAALPFWGCDRHPSPAQASIKPASLLIAMDGSDRSPVALEAWVRSWFAYAVDPAIMALPYGGFVHVTRCGDMTQPPDHAAKRVQKRDTPQGMTRKKAVEWTQAAMLRVSAATRNAPYRRSELTHCMQEIAAHIRQQAATLFFLSDCAEWVKGGVDCENAGKPCALPAPGFALPATTYVVVRGCGTGYPASHAAHLQREWGRFFEKAGIKKGWLEIHG